MTTPVTDGADLEHGWTRGVTGWTRYVPDQGILRVMSRPGGTYSWHLSFSASVPLTGRTEGFASAGDAMRDAAGQTARTPPGLFDALGPAEAQALYLRLFRAAGHLRGDDTLPALYRRIMVCSLAPGYDGPHPLTVSTQARQWRQAAARTGLREYDFDPRELSARGEAGQHVSRAALEFLAGRPDGADQELRLAMNAAHDDDPWPAIAGLRTRMNEATAVDRTAQPVRQFDRVTFPVSTRLERGVVEWVTGGNGRNGGRDALVYPDGRHLWPGYWASVPYGDLTVTGRGTDPVTADTARPYVRYLPPGTDVGAVSRDQLAGVIRRGQFDAGSTRQAIAYHQEHHNAGAGRGSIGQCPSPRCQTAAADWRQWARQAAPSGWRNHAGQFTGPPVTAARRAGTAPVRAAAPADVRARRSP